MSIPAYPVVDATTGKKIRNPSRPITYGVKTSTIKDPFDSSHSQRRARSKPINTFEFKYVALNATEYLTLRNFFISRLGSVEAFTWVDPVSKITYKVIFAMDVFQAQNTFHNVAGPLYELSIKLEEVP